MTVQEHEPRPERIEITTGDGLVLRQLIPEDAQAYFDALHHDPSRFQHGEERTLKRYPTVEDVRRSIEETGPEVLRTGVWDGGLLAAYAKLEFNRPKSAELGYWSGYSGHDYSERATRALVDYGFTNYDIDKITAWAAVDNAGSRKILNRLGFIQTTDGSDQVFYELTRPDSRA